MHETFLKRFWKDFIIDLICCSVNYFNSELSGSSHVQSSFEAVGDRPELQLSERES